MNLPNNPWSEYKSQNPASAASIKNLFFRACFVVITIGFTIYALKCVPFQSTSIGATPTIIAPEVRNASADELSKLPFASHISLTKKKIAASHPSGS